MEQKPEPTSYEPVSAASESSVVEAVSGALEQRDDSICLYSPYSGKGLEQGFSKSGAYELGSEAEVRFEVNDQLPKDEFGIAIVANFSSANHHHAGAEYSLLDVRGTDANVPFLLVKDEFSRPRMRQAAAEGVDPIQKMRQDVKGLRPSAPKEAGYGVYVADEEYDTSGFDFSELSNADFALGYDEKTKKVTIGTGRIGVKFRVNQETASADEAELKQQPPRKSLSEKLTAKLGLAATNEA